MIHPQIQQIKDYSQEWKQEANELLYQHPHKDRILNVLDNPDLAKRIGRFHDFPNCFGTAFWTFGILNTDFPEIVLGSEVSRMLRDNGFRIIEKQDLPERATKDIFCLEEISPEFEPIHGAVYLGKSSGIVTIFEQKGTGGVFRIAPVLGYLVPPVYFIRNK